MILFLLVVSILFNLILIYGLNNSLKKIETYERYIQRFYNGSLEILARARMLDDKQMFEKDDEVGILFEQLLIVIGDLRVLIYDGETEEEKEEV